MKLAVLYARVSTKDQEREGFSIPSQLSLLQEYAEKNSLHVVKEFVESESAKKAGRTKFNAMLSFLRETPGVKDILVEKSDRLSRNFRDAAAVDPDTTGFVIHLVKENAVITKDSKSTAKLMWSIKTSLAKHYSDNLSEEARKGQEEKAKQGIYPSSAPFGYRNRLENRTIEPDPERAPFVRRGFELAASGQHSLAKIAQELNAAGARTTRRLARLSKSQVQDILGNPIHFGSFMWAGRLYEGKHEPIISKLLFDRAQEAMGRRQKPKLVKHESTYGGLLICGHCGCAVTPDHKKKGQRRYVYYRCTNGKRKCTNVVYLREEKIEASFAEALKCIQLSPEAVELTRKALLESAADEQAYRAASVKKLRQELDKLQHRIERCYTDHLDGKIEAEEWETRTAAWKLEQADVRAKLLSHERSDLRYMQEGIRLLEVAARAHDLFMNGMTPAEKRETISLVLSNPRIEGGTVRYEFRKPYDLMAFSLRDDGKKFQPDEAKPRQAEKWLGC